MTLRSPQLTLTEIDVHPFPMYSFQIVYGNKKILKMSALILICYRVIKMAIGAVRKTCLSVRPVLFSPLATTDSNIVSVINGSRGNYFSVGLVTALLTSLTILLG